MGGAKAGKLNTLVPNTTLFSSVKGLFDRWAAASAALRQNILTLTGGGGAANTTTVVRIDAEGAHKTVITMGGTNSSFRSLEECMDWVSSHLVSL